MSQLANSRAQALLLAWSALLVLAGAVALASTADAAPTTQAIADNGAFLAYAPAPFRRAGLCLVDTGVNENPSTEGPVVDRVALDNGTGDDVSPAAHGTILAMLAAAPANGWGTVGTAPNSIQIVSVRILEPGETTFPFGLYYAGITRCLELRGQYNIKVINLSLGTSSTPTNQDYEAVGDAIERATDLGVAVVAAAGNDNGGPVGYPAAYPTVLSVAASNTTNGELCAFSNRGAALRMTAPGCQLQSADPTTGAPNYNTWQGTSEASAIDAAALTALYAYDPTLSPQAAENDLSTANDGVLDIAQTFIDAGLGQLVAEAQQAEPLPYSEARAQTTPAQATPDTSPNAATPPPDLPRSTPVITTSVLSHPQAHLDHDGAVLLLALLNRPPQTRAQVRCLIRRPAHKLRVLKTLTDTRATLPLNCRTVAEIQVRYQTKTLPRTSGPWSTLQVPRARAQTHRASR